MKFPSVKAGPVLFLSLTVIIVLAATGLSMERGKRLQRLYDLEQPLTCSKPSQTATTGRTSTAETDYYRLSDDVWISMDAGTMAGEEAWLYVVRADEGKLADGDALEDVSGNVERVFLEKGRAPNTFLVWKAPLEAGKYHVVVDFSPLGVYTKGVDLIDDISTMGVGFSVAYPMVDYIRIDPLPGNNVIDGGCTRVQGTGISQYWERFNAYGWNKGPNRIPEDGGGDDINLGQITPVWSTDVPDYLGTINELGTFLAAIDYRCGDGLVFASYDTYTRHGELVTLADTATIAVLPPDWIPGDSTTVLSE